MTRNRTRRAALIDRDAVVSPSPSSRRSPSCSPHRALPPRRRSPASSGFSYIDSGGVRLFEVEKRSGSVPLRLHHAAGRPRSWIYASLAGDHRRGLRDGSGLGNRVLIEIYEFADGGGGSALGWFDVRTGKQRVPRADNTARPTSASRSLRAILGSGRVYRPRARHHHARRGGRRRKPVPNRRALFHIPFAKGRSAREKRITVVIAGARPGHNRVRQRPGLTWRTQGDERVFFIPADTSLRAPTLAPPRRTHRASVSAPSPAPGLYPTT